MANLKAVRTRISSTISTQQITKAMKLVSATKLKKATDAITQMRPYADKLYSILSNLADSAREDEEVKGYFEHREVKKALVLVLSSDRGLCGAFNSNVIKATKQLVESNYSNGEEVEVRFLGKKAYEYFKRFDWNMNTDNMDLFQDLSANRVFDVSETFITDFLKGEYDEIRVVYNSFKNAATQIVRSEKLLPVEMESFEGKEEGESNWAADYIFEPNKSELLQELVPRAVKTKLYKSCLDSVASEHGARMVAMDKATENAGELLDALRLEYNQARQAAITTEILEIVSGAAALEG
jgi:F-type H+-transporting ATPase subunit gamma